MEQPPEKPADTGQASYGNSGEQTGLQGLGQSSASTSGHDEADLMDQEPLAAEHSTSAQRSGGQNEDGEGSGNDSFAGSSLGGIAGSPDAAAAMFNSEQPSDGSGDAIDPTTGQMNDDGSERQGQATDDKAKPSDLDGE